MESLNLNVVPSPTSNDHQVRIEIDGQDWLGENYLGIDPPRFFSQSALITGGKAIVARCSCGEEGCDSYIADVIVKDDTVTWKINKGYILSFEKTAYLKLIKSAANDFSWENKERTVERRVGEVFKGTKLNDGYSFNWASGRLKQGKISLSFSKEASQRILDFEWTDGNPETAVVSAIQFKTEILKQEDTHMPEIEYEFSKNEDWSIWDYGETEAVVVDFGATQEGLPRWEDNDVYYHWWIYEYEYSVPETAEKQKFTGKIKFTASGYAYHLWFSKYPKGFKFIVRFNKANPAQHSRMIDFTLR